MRRWTLAAAGLAALLIPLPAGAADGESPQEKLGKARAAFQASFDTYRASVNAYLDKREEAARADGNKKLVDQVKAERKAFADNGDAPKALPVNVRTQLGAAKGRMEAAFKAAVAELTKAKQDDEAAAVEKEWEAFRATGAFAGAGRPDPFQKGTVWATDGTDRKITVIDRQGDTFRAHVDLGPNFQRVVNGKIKDGKLHWLAKDVEDIKGGKGGDNYGAILGNKIEFIVRDPNGIETKKVYTVELKPAR